MCPIPIPTAEHVGPEWGGLRIDVLGAVGELADRGARAAADATQ